MKEEKKNIQVFISWSGDRSLQVAKAFYELLKEKYPVVNPWISSLDISAGHEWLKELEKNIKKSNIGILFITKENLDSHWIIFEAGALYRTSKCKKIIPYLIEIKKDEDELPQPLTMFQAKESNKRETKELIKSILEEIEVDMISKANEKTILDNFWQRFNKRLKNNGNDLSGLGVKYQKIKSLNKLIEQLIDIMPTDEKKYTLEEMITILQDLSKKLPERIIKNY